MRIDIAFGCLVWETIFPPTSVWNPKYSHLRPILGNLSKIIHSTWIATSSSSSFSKWHSWVRFSMFFFDVHKIMKNHVWDLSLKKHKGPGDRGQKLSTLRRSQPEIGAIKPQAEVVFLPLQGYYFIHSSHRPIDYFSEEGHRQPIGGRMQTFSDDQLN